MHETTEYLKIQINPYCRIQTARDEPMHNALKPFTTDRLYFTISKNFSETKKKQTLLVLLD